MQVTFPHTWFPKGKFISFWNFYNKINLVQDTVTEQPNSKKFFAKLAIPTIVQSESNKRNIQNLINMTEDLKIGIRSSIKKCSCLRFDDLIFGRLDQAK